MISRLFYFFMSKLKGGEDMMAMFFAQRVILGKTAYNDVPSTLQPAVREILIDSGLEFLIEEQA